MEGGTRTPLRSQRTEKESGLVIMVEGRELEADETDLRNVGADGEVQRRRRAPGASDRRKAAACLGRGKPLRHAHAHARGNHDRERSLARTAAATPRLHPGPSGDCARGTARVRKLGDVNSVVKFAGKSFFPR